MSDTSRVSTELLYAIAQGGTRVSTEVLYAIGSGGVRVSTAVAYAISGSNQNRISSALLYAIVPGAPGKATITTHTYTKWALEVTITPGPYTDKMRLYVSDEYPVVLDAEHLYLDNIYGEQTIYVSGLQPGTDYYFVVVSENGGGETISDTVTDTTDGYGDPPELRVGNITGFTAQLLVTNRYRVPGILEVRYQTALQSSVGWTDLIDEYYDLEEESYTRDLSNLTNNTDYKSRAKFRWTDGWSGWSNILLWRTHEEATGAYWGYVGFQKPRFGEIVRGSNVEVFLQDTVVDTEGIFHPSSNDTLFNLYISSELEGENWTFIKDFTPFATMFDSTVFPDGIEYRLKVVGNLGTTYYLNALKIDNAHDTDKHKWVGWRQFDKEDVKEWAEIWHQGTYHWGGPWGPPNDWQTPFGLFGAVYSPYGGMDCAFVNTKRTGRFWDCTVEGRIGGGEGGFIWGRQYDQELSAFGLAVAATGNVDSETFKGYRGSVQTFLGFPYTCALLHCIKENYYACTRGYDGNIMSGVLASSIFDPVKDTFEVMMGEIVGLARACNFRGVSSDPEDHRVFYYPRPQEYSLRVRLEQDTDNPADCWLRIHAEGPYYGDPDGDYWTFNIKMLNTTPECGWAGFYRWHIANEPGGTEDAGWAAYDSFGATLLPDTNVACDYIEPPPQPLCESILKTPTVRVAVDCASSEVKVTASDYLTKAETFIDPDNPEQGYEGGEPGQTYIPNSVQQTKWTLWEKGNETALVEDLLQGKVPTYNFTGYDPGVYEVEVCFYDKCGTQCNKVQFCIPCPCENAALKDFSELRLGPLVSLEDHKKALIDFETKFNQLVKALRGS